MLNILTMDELKHSSLTSPIIKAFYKVYNSLGYGFLEKVYHNALRVELQRKGLNVRSLYPIKVYYESRLVGDYIADLVVDEKVILELKAMEWLHEQHEHQLINYLKATEMEVGLLLNFGPEPQFKRKILTQVYRR